jgi:hypothetical protein
MKPKTVRKGKPIRIALLDTKFTEQYGIDSSWAAECITPCSVEISSSMEQKDGNSILPLYSRESHEVPHVVLSSSWLDLQFVQAIHNSERLRMNHTSPDFTLRQAYGIINMGNFDKYPLHEDLGKIDILLSPHRYSDVRIIDTKNDKVSLEEFHREREPKFPLKVFISSYDKDAVSHMCNDEEKWYGNYLRKLSELISIESNDLSCLQGNDFRSITPDHKIRIVFHSTLTPDSFPPGFVKFLNKKEFKDELVVYFGHPSIREYVDESGRLSELEGWFTVTFPCKNYAKVLNVGPSNGADPNCKLELPYSRVLSIFDFPGGVEQMSDYLSYVSSNQHAFERHFKNSNIPDREITAIDEKAGQNFICKVCDFFKKKYYYERR